MPDWHHPISLCNCPPGPLADWEFNDSPRPLTLDGVRPANRRLFDSLEHEDKASRRADIFNEFMSVKFQLHHWPDFDHEARLSLRKSYIRFLRGWAFDSNTVEAAVLKAWVESRFGLPVRFHRTCLRGNDPDAHLAFAVDRMRGSSHTNAIFSQLDLLYEYGQFELARRFGGPYRLTLYRGTHDKEAYPVVHRHAPRDYCVELNNLSSFTSDRERAWEFGTTVWQAEVATPKIFHFSALLPERVLKGENEFLVMGGHFRVRELIC